MSAAAFRLGQTIEAAELTAVGSSKTAGTFSNDGHYNARPDAPEMTRETLHSLW